MFPKLCLSYEISLSNDFRTKKKQQNRIFTKHQG